MKQLVAAIVLSAALALPANAYVTNLLRAHITSHAGNELTLKLEMATTPETRETGLMNRKSLKPADGMVFFFPEAARYKFWMKNTLIPLDMLFVDEDGTIVYIATAEPLSLKPVGPKVPVDTVIEIAGGRAAREGIIVGNKVTYDMHAHPRDLAR